MNILNSKAGMLGAGVLAAGLVVYFFGRKLTAVAGDAVNAVRDVNVGTPYEGAGVLGTLGNLTNQVSGGVFQRWGEALGESIFNVFNKPFDPNNPNTPALRKYATERAPVRPVDSPTIYVKH